MEPFISADGNYIFFNNLNDNISTSLYYALKVNDSTFNFAGPISGANQTVTPRLDAVPSSDSANNFFWTSTRNFPAQMDNCFHGIFNGTNVLNIGRIHGTLYIYNAGWIMMDAATNYSGNQLYYTNGYFGPTYAGCGGIPCQAKIGIAEKQNDSTFNKIINSDSILQSVNDTINYVVYAPFITKDGLELYYTRILHNPVQSEICVSVRTSTTGTFSYPSIIYASPLNAEAPTLTTDQSKMYYHKNSGGVFKIFLRYRTSATGINNVTSTRVAAIYPNPFSIQATLHTDSLLNNATLKVDNCFGQTVREINNISGQSIILHRDNLPGGLYQIRIIEGNKIIFLNKFVITD